MQMDYHKKRAQLPVQKRQKWMKQQKYIRNLISETDSFPWKLQELQLVAGVDVSFSSKFKDGACAGLLIYSVKHKKIIYQDYEYVILLQEYVPGFLAFRELPPTLRLFQKLKKNRPDLWPQVILVDGNGIMHKNQCGYASHLGVLLDTPSIGCAKSFFDIDGLHQDEVEGWLKDKLVNEGETVAVKGKSGREWCRAMLVNQDHDSHLFISIGHKISLGSAEAVVMKVRRWEMPQPVRLVDQISRKMIKKMWQKDYKQASSYEMTYIAK